MKTRSLSAILRGAANPNVPGAEGRTAVHRAAREGRVEDLKVLLVHCALDGDHGNPDALKLLLEAGADPNVRDKKGTPPVFYTVNSSDDLQLGRGNHAAHNRS